jgi:hypothetical protein
MKNKVNNQLELLVFLFGNHYGTGLYLLNTPMNDIPKIQNLVEAGELSPSEINDIIRGKK